MLKNYLIQINDYKKIITEIATLHKLKMSKNPGSLSTWVIVGRGSLRECHKAFTDVGRGSGIVVESVPANVTGCGNGRSCAARPLDAGWPGNGGGAGDGKEKIKLLVRWVGKYNGQGGHDSAVNRGGVSATGGPVYRKGSTCDGSLMTVCGQRQLSNGGGGECGGRTEAEVGKCGCAVGVNGEAVLAGEILMELVRHGDNLIEGGRGVNYYSFGENAADLSGDFLIQFLARVIQVASKAGHRVRHGKA